MNEIDIGFFDSKRIVNFIHIEEFNLVHLVRHTII